MLRTEGELPPNRRPFVSTTKKNSLKSKKKKFKRVMILDNKDSVNISDYLSGLPLTKKYKITIEEM